MRASRAGFQRDIFSLDEIFRFLENFVEAAGVDTSTARCIDLVVEELFTNMVRHNHGGSDQIAIELERTGDRLRIELTDFDVDDFDPSSVPEPPVAASIAERRPGGLGLRLVRTMVDELQFEYEPQDRQMRVRVTKNLEN